MTFPVEVILRTNTRKNGFFVFSVYRRRPRIHGKVNFHAFPCILTDANTRKSQKVPISVYSERPTCGPNVLKPWQNATMDTRNCPIFWFSVYRRRKRIHGKVNFRVFPCIERPRNTRKCSKMRKCVYCLATYLCGIFHAFSPTAFKEIFHRN